MTAKLHVKVGAIELDFEGESELIKSDILPILDKLITKPVLLDKFPEPEKPEDTKPDLTNEPVEELSVDNIASRLQVVSGSELVLAVCFYLKYIEKKSEFPRQVILETMKTSHSFYKETYRKNLSRDLAQLVRNKKLNERKPNVYAFPQPIYEGLKQKIAG